MGICPKCGEDNLKWCETKNKKHWLKRDLGDGQVGKTWHDCGKGGELGSKVEIEHKLRPFCIECNTLCISCGECKNCEYGGGFCPKCQVHVSVNMK